MKQNYSEIPPRKRRNKTLLKKLNIKNTFLFILFFIFISTFFRWDNLFLETTDGLIPSIIKILVVILILSVCGFLYTFKNKLKLLEVTILKWSFIIGLLTTFIGFSISTFTTELIKEQESKEKVAALLDYYQVKYEREKTNINSTNAIFTLIPTIVDQIGANKVFTNKSDGQGDKTINADIDQHNLIDVKEPFLSFIAQNIDYYSLLSPKFQDCLKNWDPINDKYNVKLLNQGYPMENPNIELSKEDLEKKRAEYLITLAKVKNEINKRSTIIEIEQKYLRGEITSKEHDKEITILLALFHELDSELLNIETVKEYQNYLNDYEEIYAKILNNIIKRHQNGDRIIYSY